MLFVHSAFPTLSPDSVFFGPDTYRFAGLIERTIAGLATPPRSILDLGCGSAPAALWPPAPPQIALSWCSATSTRLP
jgi:methylase of polypeptide subunit release factors